MHTHDPPPLDRLRRIDRRLLVLNRRVRKLMAEREELLARLRSAPGAREAPAMPGAHEAYGTPEASTETGVPVDPVRESPVARRAPGVYEKPETHAAPGAGEDRASARGAAAPRRPEAERVLLCDPPPAWVAPGAPETPAARGASGTPEAPAPHAQHAAPEVRRHSARNVILGLGAVLMSVAALVFAVWAWTAADTGTRVLMLLGVTGAIAWIAAPLYRRGLQATAQTLGALLVVFLAVDALLLWVLLGPDVDPAGYTAAHPDRKQLKEQNRFLHICIITTNQISFDAYSLNG